MEFQGITLSRQKRLIDMPLITPTANEIGFLLLFCDLRLDYQHFERIHPMHSLTFLQELSFLIFIVSPTLTESTRFGLVCNVKRGAEKLLNETLVRVRGDDTDPPPIFGDNLGDGVTIGSHSNTNSGTTGTGSTGGTGTNTGGTGQTNNPAPDDIRTCEPDPAQDIDTYIACLCWAEPNPAGCTIPPGGLQ